MATLPRWSSSYIRRDGFGDTSSSRTRSRSRMVPYAAGNSASELDMYADHDSDGDQEDIDAEYKDEPFHNVAATFVNETLTRRFRDYFFRIADRGQFGQHLITPNQVRDFILNNVDEIMHYCFPEKPDPKKYINPADKKPNTYVTTREEITKNVEMFESACKQGIVYGGLKAVHYIDIVKATLIANVFVSNRENVFERLHVLQCALTDEKQAVLLWPHYLGEKDRDLKANLLALAGLHPSKIAAGEQCLASAHSILNNSRDPSAFESVWNALKNQAEAAKGAVLNKHCQYKAIIFGNGGEGDPIEEACQNDCEKLREVLKKLCFVVDKDEAIFHANYREMKNEIRKARQELQVKYDGLFIFYSGHGFGGQVNTDLGTKSSRRWWKRAASIFTQNLLVNEIIDDVSPKAHPKELEKWLENWPPNQDMKFGAYDQFSPPQELKYWKEEMRKREEACRAKPKVIVLDMCQAGFSIPGFESNLPNRWRPYLTKKNPDVMLIQSCSFFQSQDLATGRELGGKERSRFTKRIVEGLNRVVKMNEPQDFFDAVVRPTAREHMSDDSQTESSYPVVHTTLHKKVYIFRKLEKHVEEERDEEVARKYNDKKEGEAKKKEEAKKRKQMEDTLKVRIAEGKARSEALEKERQEKAAKRVQMRG